MRMHKLVVAMAVLLALGVATPARAQFGAIKKGFEKVKSIRITTKEKDPASKNNDADTKTAEGEAQTIGTTGAVATDEKPATASESKPKNLKDGEVAIIFTALPESDATAKIKAYFNSKDVDFTVNADTGRINSDWYGERRCGIGFNRCANRAMVRVLSEQGQITVRVQVFERKREGGINEKPWNENSKNKGKETAQLAVELETFLAGGAVVSR